MPALSLGLDSSTQSVTALIVDLDSYEGRDLQTIAANRKVHAELLGLLKSQ